MGCAWEAAYKPPPPHGDSWFWRRFSGESWSYQCKTFGRRTEVNSCGKSFGYQRAGQWAISFQGQGTSASVRTLALFSLSPWCYLLWKSNFQKLLLLQMLEDVSYQVESHVLIPVSCCWRFIDSMFKAETIVVFKNTFGVFTAAIAIRLLAVTFGCEAPSPSLFQSTNSQISVSAEWAYNYLPLKYGLRICASMQMSTSVIGRCQV